MLLDLASWWDALSTFESIYWLIAIPSTVIFLIIVVMTFIGGEMDADADVDTDVDGDAGIGFQFLTVKNLIGFFSVFAWSGIACIDVGLPNFLVVIISVICGLIMMVIMASLLYFMSRLTDSGTLNVRNAINRLGEVYLTIPAGRNGFGKVQINIQGSMRELQAVTDSRQELPTGTVVQVLDVIDQHILLVAKSD